MTGEEFRQRRLALGLTAPRLALLIGVSPSAILAWELGRFPVPAYAAERLAEVERTRWPKGP